MLVAFEAISAIALAIYQGKAIDLISRETPLKQQLINVAVVLFIIIITQWISSVYTPWIYKKMLIKKLTKIRNDVFEKIIRISLTKLNKYNVGDISSRLTKDMGDIDSFITKNAYVFIRRCLIAIVAFIISITINYNRVSACADCSNYKYDY